jgi:hypothetical protein
MWLKDIFRMAFLVLILPVVGVVRPPGPGPFFSFDYIDFK